MDVVELDNSKFTTCAWELNSSMFNALELYHSTLRTSAQELNNSE